MSFSDTDIAAVGIRVMGLDQSVQRLPFVFSYRYHSDQDDIILENGNLTHYAFIKQVNDDGSYDQSGTFYPRPEDEELYGFPVYRMTDSIHMIIIPSIFKIYTSVSNSYHTQTQYVYETSINEYFELPEGGALRKFRVYAIVPEDMEIQEAYLDNTKLFNHLSITGLEKTTDFLKQHVTMSRLTRTDNNGKQRIYYEFLFDFGDSEIVNNTNRNKYYNLYIRNFPMAVNIDEVNQRRGGSIDPKTFSYTFYGMSTIDQDNFWYVKGKDNASGVWNDIDGDGNTEEPRAFHSSYFKFILAGYAQLESVMSVKTGLSNGYVIPQFDDDTNSFTNIAETYGSNTYTYRLKFRANEDSVGNIIFVDPLEQDALSQWHGTFQSIDVSRAEEFLGVESTIYYSESYEDRDTLPQLDDREKWKVLPDDISGWTQQQLAKVKTLAVSFNEATLTGNEYVFFDVCMTSPDYSHGDYDYKDTVNTSSVFFRPVGEGATNDDIQHVSTRKIDVRIVPFKGTIHLIKTDEAVSGQAGRLSGATFDAYKLNNNTNEYEPFSTDIVSDSDGYVTLEEVPYGTYSFVETQAPKGYELLDDPVIVELTDTVPDKIVTSYVSNQRKESLVSITKTSDKDITEKLPNAKFRLHDSTGAYVNDTVYVTDNDGNITISGIPWGSYYIEEVEPSPGYRISEAAKHVSFTISANNDAGRELNLRVTNPQIPGKVVLTKYEMLEDGTRTTTPINGALYEFFDSKVNSIGTYMTNQNGVIEIGDLDYGKYYFKETVPAVGYTLNTRMESFTLSAMDYRNDGTVVHDVITYDSRKLGNVFMVKHDETVDPVANAVYGLFRQSDEFRVGVDGKPGDSSFVTAQLGTLSINDIWWGDYYLKELRSPAGYELNPTRYNFSVNRDTVRSNIRISVTDNRLKGSVLLIKTDVADNTRRLGGAVYSLYRSDGTLLRSGITTMSSGDGIGTVEIPDIDWGNYYLQEDTPPEGYGLSDEKVRFSVNYISAGKVQEITVSDKQAAGEVKVTKRIKISDIEFKHGSPTFIFKLDGTDSTSGGHYTAYKSVTFAEDYVNSLSANNEYAEMTVAFTDVPTGSCNLSEVEVQRYEVSAISGISGNGTLSADQKSVSFAVSNSALECRATFANEKLIQSKASHTSSELNMLKKARQITSFAAIWTGDSVYTELNLDRSLLDVYVIYDDGTTEKLADDAYELWNGTQQLSLPGVNDFDPAVTMSAIIEVRYSRLGREYRDSFPLDIVAMPPFTFITTDGPFEENGVLYDGTAVITGFLGDETIISVPKKVIGQRTLLNNTTGEYEENSSTAVYKVVGMTSIASSAAYGFKNVVEVILPDSVKEVGDYTFHDNRVLESINLDGVKKIGEYAFYNNQALTSVDLDQAEEISDYAFNSCTQLSDITVGDHIALVDSSAFDNTPYYTALYGAAASGDPIFIDNKILYKFKNSKPTGEYNVPANTLCIASDAFKSDTGLTAVNFPEGLLGISKEVFSSCSGLTSITLPESLVMIGEGAFYSYRGLTEVTIPDSVVRIDSGAFSYCSNIESVTLPAGITEISDKVFTYCSKLSSIEVPEGVTRIGKEAFASCSGLISASMPDSLTVIDEAAFQGCKFTTFDIPDSVTYIGKSAFNNCSSLRSVVLPSGLTAIEDSTFRTCGSLNSVTFNEGLVSIGASAFYGCRSLRNVTFPDSLEVIKELAFYGAGFNTVQIKPSIRSIGTGAFANCKYLRNLRVDEANSGYVSEDNVLFTKDRKTLVCFPAGKQYTDYVIPLTVKNLAPYAFCGCSKLYGTITVPDGMTTIPSNLFNQCSNISRFVIPDCVTSIGSRAFLDCGTFDRQAGRLELPDTVTHIGEDAFNRCEFRSSDETQQPFRFPENLQVIGKNAFQNCMFFCSGLPCRVVVPEGVYWIDIGAFSYTKMSSIVLPQCLKSIEHEMFLGSSLEEITIPPNVAVIGINAFSGCGSLQCLKSIEHEMFLGSSLEEITIPPNVAVIGINAFSGCGSLREIILPDSVTNINSGSFAGCTSLTRVVLPNYLTYDTNFNSAFSNCININDLTVGRSLLEYLETNDSYSLANRMFSDSKGKITKITISEGITDLKPSAFAGFTALREVTIPDSLEYIRDNAFSGCSNLTTVNIGENSSLMCVFDTAFKNSGLVTNASNGLIYIGSPNGKKILYGYKSSKPTGQLVISEDTVCVCINAFQSCTGLASVTIPESVQGLGTNAFSGCSYLSSVTLSNSTKLCYVGSNVFANTPYYRNNYVSTVGGNSIVVLGSVSVDGSGRTPYVLLGFRTGNPSGNFDMTNSFPQGLVCIAENVFNNSTSLQSIKFQPTLRRIPNYSFRNKTSLRQVEIPAGVKEIGEQAFEGCTGLQRVVLPEGLESIGYMAFYGAGYSSGMSINIPSTVKTISAQAFYNSALAGELSPTAGFDWSSTEWIGKEAFIRNRSTPIITRVYFGDSLRWLGENAFANTRLEYVHFSSQSAVNINNNAFEYIGKGSDTPATVDFNGGVRSLQKKVFSDSSITSLYLDDGISYMAASAINIRLNYLTVVGNGFICDSSGKVITYMPREDILLGKLIGNRSVIEMFNFGDSDQLSINSVSILDEADMLSEYAFKNVTTGNITLPDTIKTIGYKSFSPGTIKGDLVIPESVTYINYDQFEGLEITGKIYLPSHLRDNYFCEYEDKIVFYTSSAELP